MCFRFILLIIIFVGSIGSLFAQSSFPPSSFGSVNDLPIDQGIVLALSAGVAYGFKKLSKNRKK